MTESERQVIPSSYLPITIGKNFPASRACLRRVDGVAFAEECSILGGTRPPGTDEIPCNRAELRVVAPWDERSGGSRWCLQGWLRSLLRSLR